MKVTVHKTTPKNVRRLFEALQNLADREGIARPSEADLVRITGLSGRTISRTILKAKAYGLVTRKDGRTHQNVFDITEWLSQTLKRGCIARESRQENPANIPSYSNTTPYSTDTPKCIEHEVGKSNEPRMAPMKSGPGGRPAWLLDGFVKADALNLLVGYPGKGKSYLALKIAADLTNGRTSFFDRKTAAKDALIVSYEDDAGTVQDRLIKCGADLGRVHFCEGFESQRISEIAEMIDSLLTDNPAIGLVALDPIANVTMGAARDYDESGVRAALTTFAEIAQRHNVTIIGTRHLNKQDDMSTESRVIGAPAWTAVPRSVVLVGHYREDGLVETVTSCGIVSLKVNGAMKPLGLAFSISDDGVAWGRRVPEMTDRDLLPARPRWSRVRFGDDSRFQRERAKGRAA